MMGKAKRLREERAEGTRGERQAPVQLVAAPAFPLDGPESGFELKVGRAVEHLQSLNAATQRWLETDAYTVTDEFDPNTGEHSLWLAPGQPARRLPLLIGDVIHNLRSALDHLALALAVANIRGPLPEKVEQDSEFPVYWKRAPTTAELNKRIGSIDPKARAIIEALQPHLKPNYADDALWRLDQLWNIDKHRDLHLTLLANVGHGIGRPGEVINELHIIEARAIGALRKRTQVMRYTIDPHSIVDMERVPQVEVAFGPSMPGEGEPVLRVLQALLAFVTDDVIAPLKPYL
jgi:hypothetical protein